MSADEGGERWCASDKMLVIDDKFGSVFMVLRRERVLHFSLTWRVCGVVRYLCVRVVLVLMRDRWWVYGSKARLCFFPQRPFEACHGKEEKI